MSALACFLTTSLLIPNVYLSGCWMLDAVDPVPNLPAFLPVCLFSSLPTVPSSYLRVSQKIKNSATLRLPTPPTLNLSPSASPRRRTDMSLTAFLGQRVGRLLKSKYRGHCISVAGNLVRCYYVLWRMVYGSRAKMYGSLRDGRWGLRR
jgi:hypothetical protein